MLLGLISNVVNTNKSFRDVVKPASCRRPDPEYRIKLDPKNGKIKIEEKKRNPFIVY